MTDRQIIAHLIEKYPNRASDWNRGDLEITLNYFKSIFAINLQENTYAAGTLDRLSLFLGKDFRDSELLFDITKKMSEISDTEYYTTLDTWEAAISQVVGNMSFVDSFEEYLYKLNRYRIVLTCFDPKSPPYADWYDALFSDRHAAYMEAEAKAKRECAYLNDEDGAYPPGTIEGVFEVDDCANNDFEVRWYEKLAEERDETDCDIDWITTYNVYPVLFGPDASCQYRGFEISAGAAGFSVSHNGAFLKTCADRAGALNLVDDVCLACAKDKTYALEAVHKLPLDIRLKFAEEKHEEGKPTGAPTLDNPQVR